MKTHEIVNFSQERMVRDNPKENGIYMTIRMGITGIYRMLNIWENGRWKLEFHDDSTTIVRSEEKLIRPETGNWE